MKSKNTHFLCPAVSRRNYFLAEKWGMTTNVQVYAKLKNPATFISYQKGRGFSIWVRTLNRVRTAYTLLGDVALILIGKGEARDQFVKQLYIIGFFAINIDVEYLISLFK